MAIKQHQKKDQERETNKFMYEFDKINTEMENIKKRMYLKRRYVVNHQLVVASKAKKEADAKQMHFVPMSKKEKAKMAA